MLDGDFADGVVGSTPHERLVEILAAGHHILPVLLSELGEIKGPESTHLGISPFVPELAFLQVLCGEVDALEFIEQTNVSESAIGSTRYQVPCSMHHGVIHPSIEPYSGRRLSMT